MPFLSWLFRTKEDSKQATPLQQPRTPSPTASSFGDDGIDLLLAYNKYPKSPRRHESIKLEINGHASPRLGRFAFEEERGSPTLARFAFEEERDAKPMVKRRSARVVTLCMESEESCDARKRRSMKDHGWVHTWFDFEVEVSMMLELEREEFLRHLGEF